VKLSDVASIVHGSMYGKKFFEIKDILPPDDAGRNDLTFVFKPSIKTCAGAIIASEKFKGKNGIIVKDPKEAMYLLLKKLGKSKRKKEVSTKAMIEKNVSLPKSCTIEPFAIIKNGAMIGNGTYIGAHCYIDGGAIIGRNCEIHPSTVIYNNTKIGDFVIVNSNTVIGKQGFGYMKKKRYERLSHIGNVVIKNFVEIGSNVTIDRGTIGNTVIGEGTKIDNLVQIAHNVKIGKNCIIMGQVGIAGSTKIGSNVTLCGQVGISDHLEIGDNVIVYAKSAIFKSVAKNKEYSGIPAREHRVVLRALGRLYKGL
jgi:UDP-3-O-[3-hydroxymyristoyl] glucosamine N-acyltransferase